MNRRYAYVIYARELAGQGDDWTIRSMEYVDTSRGRMNRVSGIVCPKLTRGKYKGRPDFKNGDPATYRVVTWFDDEFDAWKADWEAKTGLCSECCGDGLRVLSISIAKGTTYGTCKRCGGAKTAPLAEAAR